MSGKAKTFAGDVGKYQYYGFLRLLYKDNWMGYSVD
jgi:hypothetical protein